MNMPPTVHIGQHTQVTIERLVFQGSGLGRLLDGRVIFVPYTVPGDEVEITVTQVRDDFVRGNLVRVLSPASSRVTPACRYFGNCGGCQWQHVAYPSQLAWKREILRELLARIGKLGEATNSIPMADPIAPAHPWEYRARAQLKVVVGGRLHIGFHQQETHRVVDIDRCPLLHPRLNDVLRILRSMRDPAIHRLLPRLREVWVAVGTATGEAVVSLFARAQERAAIRLLSHRIQAEVPELRGVVLLEGDPRQHPRFVDRHGHGALVEQVGEHRFRVDATAFFQVSGSAAETLMRLVMDGAALTGAERVLDLYSGVGTFTIPLARLSREVVGIESNPAAAADAAHNLRSNDCPNARVLQAQVEQALPALAKDGSWDLIVLDPPRQGASRWVLNTILAMAVPRILYVSCDPSTLARDLGILIPSGYRCVALTPVDLFPQTFHLETVAVLQRAA